MSALFVPADQLLSPGQLLGRRVERSFPFDAPRVEYFYLARNGIWHGADALGLVPGDEVLMPAYHHGVEIETLKHKGLSIKYYRIDEKMQMDFDHLETLVGERTRMLYVIHYLGYPQPIKRILDFSERHGLFLFEDCALSLYSRAPEGLLGTFGQISIFCLYKTIPVPHGGAMVLNAPGLKLPDDISKPDWKSTVSYLSKQMLAFMQTKGGAGLALGRWLRSTGGKLKRAGGVEAVKVDTSSFEPEYVSLGISRAAHHIVDRIDGAQVVERRRANYEYLDGALGPDVRRIFDGVPAGVCPLSFPIMVRDKEATHERLLAEGVDTITFWSIDNPEIPRGTFPEVDLLRRHVLELPVHQALSQHHLEHVVNKVEELGRW